MKIRTLKKWAKLYCEAMENISIEKTGDTRFGGHSYAAWTEYYALHYKDVTVNYSVYTGDGNDMERRTKAMVEAGAIPQTYEGYYYSYYLNAFLNLRQLYYQIEHAFKAAGAKLPEYINLKAFAVFNVPAFYSKYADEMGRIVSDDADVEEGITRWNDVPCVNNPTPKLWELDLKKAQEEHEKKVKDENLEYARKVGVLSRKYGILFKTALALGENEDAYAYLCDLRGKLLSMPKAYRISTEKLMSRNTEERDAEIKRLISFLNDERAAEVPFWSSERDTYRITAFFLETASVQGYMLRQEIKRFVVYLCRKSKVLDLSMAEELEEIIFQTGKAGAYILEKDLEHLPEAYWTDVRKRTILDKSYSNAGVKRALRLYVPRFARYISEKGVDAYDGDILGLSLVRGYVSQYEE